MTNLMIIMSIVLSGSFSGPFNEIVCTCMLECVAFSKQVKFKLVCMLFSNHFRRSLVYAAEGKRRSRGSHYHFGSH